MLLNRAYMHANTHVTVIIISSHDVASNKRRRCVDLGGRMLVCECSRVYED